MDGGIIIYLAGPGLVITGNNVFGNDIGIWLTSSNEKASVSHNGVGFNYGYGLVFDSTKNTANNNKIYNSPVGILAFACTSAATVTTDGNAFSHVPTHHQALSNNKPYSCPANHVATIHVVA